MSQHHPHLQEAPKAKRPTGERLDSWKEIAAYLNRDVRTVQRWEATAGLPVHRKSEIRLKGSPVYAFAPELEAWLRRNPPSQTEGIAEPTSRPRNGLKPRLVLWTVVSLCILVSGGAAVRHFLLSRPSSVPLRVVQLTNYPGLERHPAISPDGKQVAFSWNGENQDNFDIYVRFIDGGKPLRLTTHPGVDGWPAWSPDGRTIAFVRWVLGAQKVELLTVPALGGDERSLLQAPAIPPSPGWWPVVCWTPDGKWIIVPLSRTVESTSALVLVSVETREIRPLTEPARGSVGDCSPALAPDGSKLAFLRAGEGRVWNVYILALGPDYRPIGEPRESTAEPFGVLNPMWTGDGREVLYIVNRDGERALMRVPYDRSRPATPLESLGPIGTGWAISPRGDRLVYTDVHMPRMQTDIWRVELPTAEHVNRIVSSSAPELNPEIAPDGERIAFISERGHGQGLYVSDPDGAEPLYLAPIVGAVPAPARWAPDGSRLVFECQNEGNDDICTVPAGGGPVRRVTSDPAQDLSPSWSRDGKWIYFSSRRSGSDQVWKVPAEGSEASAVQITRGGGFYPVESWDGTSVFFARSKSSMEIWQVPAVGGEEREVGRFQRLLTQNFTLAPEGIYYPSSTEPERGFEIRFYRFSNRTTEQICRVNKRLWTGFSVSPDGRWLAAAANDTQTAGDLYMVEHFR